MKAQGKKVLTHFESSSPTSPLPPGRGRGKLRPCQRSPAASKSKTPKKYSSPKKLYPWFDAALKLERRGKRTSAVTAIFISINELMKEKKFSTINDFLKSLDATDYSLSILEGILSITRPISSHLSARNKFLQDVRAEVTSCGEDPDEALRGLEGQPYDESSLQDE